MLGYIWLAIKIALVLIVAGFLHYTLPDREIVRVVETEVRRVDLGENSIFWAAPDSGNATGGINRDVFFIQTVRPNGRPMVFRNEDTGAGWPPYFKFDTANLQTEATDLKSTAADPQWAVVRHYGWRIEYLSIYPNAVTIDPVEGPDVRLIPWFNIFFLLFLAAVFWAIYVRLHRFKQNRITPRVEQVDAAIDERRAGMGRWWRRLTTRE